jgi:hypothetical protein
VNCVADSKAKSIGIESPNSPIAAFETLVPWPSLIFVINARRKVFQEAIINGAARGIGKIAAVPEPGRNVQVGVADEELAGKKELPITKESHARTAHVTSLNHKVRTMEEH